MIEKSGTLLREFTDVVCEAVEVSDAVFAFGRKPIYKRCHLSNGMLDFRASLDMDSPIEVGRSYTVLLVEESDD